VLRSLSAARFCLLLLAACEPEDPMTLVHPNPSVTNWGRNVRATTASTQEHQLVRLKLSRPTDVSLYLKGLEDNQAAHPMTYQVTVGSGGVPLYNGALQVPAVGACRHYVADTIDVTATIPGAAVSPTNPRSVGAVASLGSPTPTVEYGGLAQTIASVHGPLAPNSKNAVGYSWGWTLIAAAAPAIFRVPPWATGVNIKVRGATAAADGRVIERSASGGFPATGDDSIALYGNTQPLSPDAWFIEISNSNVGVGFFALVTFHVLS
jgi:hypothetical protein